MNLDQVQTGTHGESFGLQLVPSSERWLSFIDSMPNATIFHHPAWMNMIAECYGYHPFLVAICNDKGEVVAGLPIMKVNSWLTGRRWIALPFTDHCEPLFVDESSREQLFTYIWKLQAHYAVPQIEVRASAPQRFHANEDNNQVWHHRQIGSDSDAVFMTFHPTRTRSKIRRAEREGVRVSWGTTVTDMRSFYDLHVNTRHRLGVPVQPWRFFKLMWERLIDPGSGFVLLAFKDGLPIAGGIFLMFSNTLSFKFAASDSSYWHLNPNNLLIWTAIRWGCENGFSVFDMGKTHVTNSGLRDFKSGWGTQEVALTYSRWPVESTKQIPDHFQGVLNSFIRKSPRWVCRLAGELLYKHSA